MGIFTPFWVQYFESVVLRSYCVDVSKISKFPWMRHWQGTIFRKERRSGAHG